MRCLLFISNSWKFFARLITILTYEWWKRWMYRCRYENMALLIQLNWIGWWVEKLEIVNWNWTRVQFIVLKASEHIHKCTHTHTWYINNLKPPLNNNHHEYDISILISCVCEFCFYLHLIPIWYLINSYFTFNATWRNG